MAIKKVHERLAAYAFGVAFVVVMLGVAIAIPHPSPFQYEVFKIVLALAAAGVAAFIPGFLAITIAASLRAGGAMAVFVIVYFFTPAQLAVEPPKPPEEWIVFKWQLESAQTTPGSTFARFQSVELRELGSSVEDPPIARTAINAYPPGRGDDPASEQFSDIFKEYSWDLRVAKLPSDGKLALWIWARRQGGGISGDGGHKRLDVTLDLSNRRGSGRFEGFGVSSAEGRLLIRNCSLRWSAAPISK